ncbi:uncharacterized protein LOC130986876 [Salvia miltiorrhiza]|uniref:uncharacterized protein LOC130986876 n=1 Tax=Salvia miltiorrhiza TaxID=226208 RepID=UPI0025AC9E08|nr:uncharacterized protein LOC130986876 [Salvia miltiorrhiza]XP_057766392.1 uncharacterized protein LOC130986876 [Salvia miltiorrhiza]
MISLKTITTRNFSNDRLTLLISSDSYKFMYLSSISRRPFSRSAQSIDEKISSFTQPLGGFFRRVLFGEERAESNRIVAENAKSEETSVGDRLRNLEEEVRVLNEKGCETVKNLEPLSEKTDPMVAPKMEKRGLSALLTDGEKGHSDSTVAPKKKRSLSALFKHTEKVQSKSKSNSVSKSKSVPESPAPVEKTAYGMEDPMVHKELSSDMKMFAEHLYAKGYLKKANFMPQDRFDPTYFEASYAREFLKCAAVKFGEEHSDITRWLSAGDLKKVALFGCPSLGQRSVVAAKHMRSFFKIDEPKVCQACTLKELCRRSNKSNKKHPSKLYLDSVIKVLIMYAMESVPQKLVVPEDVKNSVHRLLKEITSLSQEKP